MRHVSSEVQRVSMADKDIGGKSYLTEECDRLIKQLNRVHIENQSFCSSAIYLPNP